MATVIAGHCSSCRALAPRLARWSVDFSDRRRPWCSASDQLSIEPHCHVPPAIVEAVRTRATPPFTRDVERVVYDFVTEYLDTNRVATPNYKRAVDAFGEQGVVDLVGVCGYYMLVSMTLNVFEMPLPPGEPEPLA